jgi:hypothetical protein
MNQRKATRTRARSVPFTLVLVAFGDKGNLLPVWQINKEIANRNEPFGERKFLFYLFCLALQDTIS